MIDQLPNSFILLRDFNCHNTSWGNKVTDLKGKTVEKLRNENDLCLLNKGAYAYINPFSERYSAIDLTICHSVVYWDISWGVKDDTYRSNHFLILLESIKPSNENISYWKMNKANWEKFKGICKENLIQNNNIDSADHFTEILINVVKRCVPKNPTPNRRNRPCCLQAIKLRKASLQKFNK